MEKLPIIRTTRGIVFGSPDILNRCWNYRGKKLPSSYLQLMYKSANEKRTQLILDVSKVEMVYKGPTVEGPDAEYIKVVSGKIDKRRPLFL
ncbi:hypothetical protein [Paenibacillus soyae]|uniref:Uncharacterized protein n=1 Tax=Paenibacillus soyae TaxID=2969249 RepID=A0A9X2MIZ9_9BACL|nr:hypothetical protein [Paenibacillus soyae]MCR2802678.1 hypothetical protein [Paenibacillus soyae]